MLAERQEERDAERQRIEAGKRLTREEVYRPNTQPRHVKRSFAEQYQRGAGLLEAMKNPAKPVRTPEDPFGPLMPKPIWLSKSTKMALPPALPTDVPDHVLDLYYKPTIKRPGLDQKQKNFTYPPEMEERRRKKPMDLRPKPKPYAKEDIIPVEIPQEEIRRTEPIAWKPEQGGVSLEKYRFFLQDVDQEMRPPVTEDGEPADENRAVIGRMVEIRR